MNDPGESSYEAARRYNRWLPDVVTIAKKARGAATDEGGDLLAPAEEKGMEPLRGED